MLDIEQKKQKYLHLVYINLWNYLIYIYLAIEGTYRKILFLQKAFNIIILPT